MFGQIFFIAMGLYLIVNGATDSNYLNVVLGIICAYLAIERLYEIKTGNKLWSKKGSEYDLATSERDNI